MKRKTPPPSSPPLGAVPTGAIGKTVTTIMTATRRPGGAADLGKKLAQQGNQPKNPAGGKP